jgi:hypothetical protein
VRRLQVTASVVLCSPFLVTLITEALSSSETSVLTRAILNSHRRENLKSYFPSDFLPYVSTVHGVSRLHLSDVRRMFSEMLYRTRLLRTDVSE